MIEPSGYCSSGLHSYPNPAILSEVGSALECPLGGRRSSWALTNITSRIMGQVRVKDVPGCAVDLEPICLPLPRGLVLLQCLPQQQAVHLLSILIPGGQAWKEHEWCLGHLLSSW